MVEISPSPGLSLLAEFDDLNRFNAVLNDGYAEEYFLRFLDAQQQWRQQLSGALAETARLQRELHDELAKSSAWESKLTHARRLLDAEKQRRARAERERDSLEQQMRLARDLLFNDNRAKLNDETLEKLAFLNNTSTMGSRASTAGLLEPTTMGANHHARLNTIAEMNSTGNLLSDQSFSRSEDDLDESLASNRRRSWKRHRPSIPSAPPSIPTHDDHPSAKKSRSTGGSKLESNASNNNRLIATTTVTVDRPTNGARNGRITASSVIEGAMDDDLPMSAVSQPTPKSTKTEYNVHISSKGDGGHFSTNLKEFMPPPEIKINKEPENAWIGIGNTVGSPRGPVRLRQHTFQNKTMLKSEPCTTCGNKIRFAKAIVKCTDCRAVCHVNCKEKLPLPCVPCHNTQTTNSMGTIADYTPNVSPMVPALIIHCVNEVEVRGLNEVGLYRVPGSEKEVKALKEKFLKNKGTPPLTNIDINVICGCIKDFLRSLREPLITNSLWSDFISATEIQDPSDSEAALYQAISELPQPNRDTLAFMMLHLQRVADCIECKMPADNLAKVFGPTIVGYSDSDSDPNDMFAQTLQQFTVMKRLLGLSSDYWARFAAVVGSDGSSVVATPPLLRTPSLRPRINTMPQLTPRAMNLMHTPAPPTPREALASTPSLTSSSKCNSVRDKTRGFFYSSATRNDAAAASRTRKFYPTPEGV